MTAKERFIGFFMVWTAASALLGSIFTALDYDRLPHKYTLSQEYGFSGLMVLLLLLVVVTVLWLMDGTEGF